MVHQARHVQCVKAADVYQDGHILQRHLVASDTQPIRCDQRIGSQYANDDEEHPVGRSGLSRRSAEGRDRAKYGEAEAALIDQAFARHLLRLQCGSCGCRGAQALPLHDRGAGQ